MQRDVVREHVGEPRCQAVEGRPDRPCADEQAVQVIQRRDQSVQDGLDAVTHRIGARVWVSGPNQPKRGYTGGCARTVATSSADAASARTRQ